MSKPKRSHQPEQEQRPQTPPAMDAAVSGSSPTGRRGSAANKTNPVPDPLNGLNEIFADPEKLRQFLDRRRHRKRKDQELKEATAQRKQEDRTRDEMRRERERFGH